MDISSEFKQLRDQLSHVVDRLDAKVFQLNLRISRLEEAMGQLQEFPPPPPVAPARSPLWPVGDHTIV